MMNICNGNALAKAMALSANSRHGVPTEAAEVVLAAFVDT